MPKRFILSSRPTTGTGWTGAPTPRRLFERLPDGSYVCGGHGSTVWIRCIAHHAEYFEHVDGGGELHRYRLVPLPPEPGD